MAEIEITVENITQFKNKRVILKELHPDQARLFPQDSKLKGRCLKIINKLFQVEDANGILHLLRYGAKVETL